MVLMKFNKIAVMLSILLFCWCNRDIWSQIRHNNFEIVEKGTYRGTLKYMPQPGKYEKFVNQYRREIEKNIDLLPSIVRQHFSVAESLVFQYKFTWLDEQNNHLVLRYFAHIFNDPIFAGYQILFVYDMPKNCLIKIYVSEVPLE